MTPAQYRATRCVDGRRMRHDPQPDDPNLETDIGQCQECSGDGCDIFDEMDEFIRELDR